MPKRLSVKDTTTIYYALKIGEIDGISHYTNVLPLACQFTTHTGVRATYNYGVMLNYNATAVVEYNEQTRYINEFTKFWYGTAPNDSSEVNDYTVVRVGEPQNGLFIIYLASVTQNADNIWYAVDDKIFLADVKFDRDELTVIIPRNQYLPIWYDTKVWYREPKSLDTTDYGLRLLDIAKEANYTRFSFEEGLYEDG